MSATGQRLPSWNAPTAAAIECALPASSEETPVAAQVVTYILLLPLLVFSVHGAFSFEHASWNSGLGAVSHGIALASSGAETLQERLQAWIALFICLAAMVPNLARIVGLCAQMPSIVLLTLYAISSAFWSQDAGASLRSGGYLLFSTLFAFYLAGRFNPEQQMQLMLFTGGCVAALSVVTALLFPQYGVDHQVHEGAWQGIFTQKNVCAEVMLFLITPALALPCRGRCGQALRALYLSLALLVIFMTQSRTAWAVTALYFAFVGMLRVLGRFERREMLPLAAFVFVSTGAAIVAAVKFLPMLLVVSARSGNFSGRSEIWGAVWTSILKRPLTGYGFDAFWSMLQGEASNVFLATGWVVTSAHSGYLNVGLELGCIGAALVALTLLRAFRNAAICFRPDRPPYVDWCIGIVVLTILYNFDERTLMATQYLPWMLYIVACTGLSIAARQARDAAIHPDARGADA